MLAQGKLARLVVMMSPCMGPKLALSRLPWTVLMMEAKSGDMSHAPASTALSLARSTFKAMEAVPAPAHSSITDTPTGKWTKDATVSFHTGSDVHGARMPGNGCACTSRAALGCPGSPDWRSRCPGVVLRVNPGRQLAAGGHHCEVSRMDTEGGQGWPMNGAS